MRPDPPYAELVREDGLQSRVSLDEIKSECEDIARLWGAMIDGECYTVRVAAYLSGLEADRVGKLLDLYNPHTFKRVGYKSDIWKIREIDNGT